MRHRTITVTLTAALLAAALAIPQAATALPTVGQSRFGRMFPAADHPATIQELADLAQVMFDPNLDADNNPSRADQRVHLLRPVRRPRPHP